MGRPAHQKVEMHRVGAEWHKRSTQRVGYWTNDYVCGVCKRKTTQVANMLGRRVPMCDGLRITKEERT